MYDAIYKMKHLLIYIIYIRYFFYKCQNRANFPYVKHSAMLYSHTRKSRQHGVQFDVDFFGLLRFVSSALKSASKSTP